VDKSSSSRPISVSSANKAGKTNASNMTATIATVVSESSASAHPAATQTESQIKGDYQNVSLRLTIAQIHSSTVTSVGFGLTKKNSSYKFS
jgi:hypothetical protein